MTTTTERDLAVLDEMERLLEAKWGQDAYFYLTKSNRSTDIADYDEDLIGRMCLVGAATYAWKSVTNSGEGVVSRLLDEIRNADAGFRVALIDAAIVGDMNELIEYNDHPHRTKAEVLAVVGKARELVQGRAA
jgi:hypothetical protein